MKHNFKMNNQSQQIYPSQQQSVGSINTGRALDVPNATLTDLEFREEMGGEEIYSVFQPSHLVEVEIYLDYKFQNPSRSQIRTANIERPLEDFVYLIQNRGLLDAEPRISFGGEVEERSGPQSPIDSYYYQGDGAVDVMTVEGENITESSIINSAKDLVRELKDKNLLI
jgi:hypothetical protein